MKDAYDLDQMKSRPNPYAKALKKQVTIRLDNDVIDYFRQMSEEVEMPYQSLINLYLKDCARSQRRITIGWQ